jgi:hypothetical protein
MMAITQISKMVPQVTPKMIKFFTDRFLFGVESSRLEVIILIGVIVVKFRNFNVLKFWPLAILFSPNQIRQIGLIGYDFR